MVRFIQKKGIRKVYRDWFSYCYFYSISLIETPPYLIFVENRSLWRSGSGVLPATGGHGFDPYCFYPGN